MAGEPQSAAQFQAPAEDYDRWTNHFAKEGFAKWLAALRHFMQNDRAAA